MSSTRRPARYAATAPTASPAGSSTPTTTKRASSSATPISSAPTIPTGALKTTLKAEIDEDAWATLHSDTSRPSTSPKQRRIAVKVINHLGDEVMKVFRVDLMEFRIADTFTDSLARLTGEEQKAVKTTAFDLQLNPPSPGMSFHKLEKAKDKNFWSVRVGSDVRLIVHGASGSLCSATSTTTTRPTTGPSAGGWRRTRRPGLRSSWRSERRSRDRRSGLRAGAERRRRAVAEDAACLPNLG